MIGLVAIRHEVEAYRSGGSKGHRLGYDPIMHRRHSTVAAVLVLAAASIACGRADGDASTSGGSASTGSASDATVSDVTTLVSDSDATTLATDSDPTTVADDSGSTTTGGTGDEPTIDCTQVPCHYVLAAAAGSGNGSDWTHAYPALPPELERGATYFVGAGSYPPCTFDDPVDGALVVTIRKARPDDHGTDTGWDDAYGTARASFDSPLVFVESHFTFDGATRNEADWFDGDAYGFHLAHAGEDTNIVIANLGVSIDDVTISHVFVDAIVEDLPDTTIRRYAIDTDGFDGGTTATNLRFVRMFVRGSNNVWFLRTTDGAIVEYCASDGAASNSANHGEIVNLYYSGNNAIIRHNYFRNAFLGPGGGGTALVAITQADGLQFYGNVARDFAVGDGTIGFDGYASSNNRVYHNTFVGNQGLNAGTAFGEGTDNLVYNNLWIDAGTVNLAGEHDFNAFGDDNPRGERNAQTNLTNAIFVDAAAGDFHLGMNTAPGMPLARPYDEDPDGAPRQTWSRGAFEY